MPSSAIVARWALSLLGSVLHGERSNCFHVAKAQVELDLQRGGRVTGLDLDISPAVFN